MNKNPVLKKQKGRIYFWKYKTDGWLGSEWHLAADTKGWNFLSQLFTYLLDSEFPVEAVIQTTPVDQKILRIPDYNSPYKDAAGLRIAYDPAGARFYDWVMTDNQSAVEIALGKAMLTEWIRVLHHKHHQNENQAIGLNEDFTLFIWFDDKE